MIASIIVRIVEASTRRPWLTLALAVLIAAGAGLYAARHFAINTNTDDLISARVPWRERQLAFDRAFPQPAQARLQRNRGSSISTSG